MMLSRRSVVAGVAASLVALGTAGAGAPTCEAVLGKVAKNMEFVSACCRHGVMMTNGYQFEPGFEKCQCLMEEQHRKDKAVVETIGPNNDGGNPYPENYFFPSQLCR